MMGVHEISDALKLFLRDQESYVSKNGAIRLCKLPHVGIHAYLHVIFEPLPRDVIDASLKSIRIKIPASVTDFLSVMNGAILFQGELSLYGVRGQISRDPEIRKPFDVIEANTLMRPEKSNDCGFNFGFYDDDGSHVFVGDNGSVSRRDAANLSVIEQWQGIDIFIRSEIARIGALYDAEGNVKK